MGVSLRVLSELVCPMCKNTLDFQQPLSSRPETVLPSSLLCKGCAQLFPVSESMVSFVKDLRNQKSTASNYGFAWKAFWKGFFDKADVFGLSFSETAQYFLSRIGLNHEDLRGLKILDAGTGSGRIPISLRNAACTVYAVDIHESLDLVAQNFKDTDTAHFFRADLFDLPFKDNFFDIAWSSGVIMITPDPAKAFAAIARKVKPGGRLFVSVYGKDLHHYRLFRHLLPFTRHLPVYVTYFLSALIAAPLYIAFNTALLLVRGLYSYKKPPYRFLGFGIEDISYKSYGSILLNLFDQLHPRYQTEHSIDEVHGWFAANGFQQTVVVESIGMVGIRGVKHHT